MSADAFKERIHTHQCLRSSRRNLSGNNEYGAWI